MFPTNVLVQEIAAKLSLMPFPLEEAVEEYIYNFRHTSSADGCYASSGDFSHLKGSVAELGISQNLSRIAEEYGSRVMMNPIQKKRVRQRRYTFYYNTTGQLTVYDQLKHCTIGDYDDLFLADGLPVVVEVKLRGGRDTKSSSKQRITRALSPEKLEKKLHPLEEYFKQPVGYLFVTSQERITGRSEAQQKYLEAGGIIVPFPMDCADYNKKLVGAFLERLVETRP